MAEKAGVYAKAQESKQKCSNSSNQKFICSSSGSPADRILQLQRTAGNQAVQRLIKSRTLQAKLKISQLNDIYEQEADRAAEQVMRMPDPVLQRKCTQCDEDEKKVLRTKEPPGKVPITQGQDVPPTVHEILRSPGQPLDPATRASMEPRFGHDFSRVRVHSGQAAEQSARDVNALAYTVGHNIVFDTGRFSPGTSVGRGLIAHELTHVVQQSDFSGTRVTPSYGIQHLAPIMASAVQIAREPVPGEDTSRIHPDTMAFLESKLCQFYELLSVRERIRLKRYSAVAIGMVTVDGEPRLVFTVASNAVNKEIKAAADKLDLFLWTYTSGVKGRGSVGAPNDAEQLMIEFAKDNYSDLHGIAVSRRVCSDCEIAIASHKQGQIQVSVIEDPIQVPRGRTSPAAQIGSSERMATAASVRSGRPTTTTTTSTTSRGTAESEPVGAVVTFPTLVNRPITTTTTSTTSRGTAESEPVEVVIPVPTLVNPGGLTTTSGGGPHIEMEIGGGIVSSGGVNVVTAIATIMLNQYLQEHFAEYRAESVRQYTKEALTNANPRFNDVIQSNRSEIKKAQAQGRFVSLHVVVEVGMVGTTDNDPFVGSGLSIGDVPYVANIVDIQVVYEGDQPKRYDPHFTLAGDLIRDILGVSFKYSSYDYPIEGTNLDVRRRNDVVMVVEATMGILAVEFEELIVRSQFGGLPKDLLREFTKYKRELAAIPPYVESVRKREVDYWSRMEKLVDAPIDEVISQAKVKLVPLNQLREYAVQMSNRGDQFSAYWANVIRMVDAPLNEQLLAERQRFIWQKGPSIEEISQQKSVVTFLQKQIGDLERQLVDMAKIDARTSEEIESHEPPHPPWGRMSEVKRQIKKLREDLDIERRILKGLEEKK